MTKLEQFCREHFNEPVIALNKLCRLVGYCEGKDDVYFILKISNTTTLVRHSMVGGVHFLDLLKNQNVVKSSSGEIWDDLYRIDQDLEPSCSREKEFIFEDETI